MHYQLLILLSIVLTILSGCQGGLSHQAPAAAPQPATIQNVGQSLHCPTDSEEARLSYNRGMDRANQGDRAEAIQALGKAIALDPAYCDAMVNLGHLLRRQGRLDEAIVWYRKSIEIFPDNPAAHNNLASVYRRQGNFEQAIAEHQWVIRRHADDPEGHFGLGIDYLQMDDYRQALKPLKQAEKLYAHNASPLVIDARHALGVAFYKLQEFEQSRHYFEQIYDRFQDDPGVNYALGLCYAFEGKQLDEARKYLKKAQQLGIEIPDEVERQVDL